MSKYRGYFMRDGHIVAPEVIEAVGDAQAMLKAGELLSTSQFHCIEVWQEARLVGTLSVPARPDENVECGAPHSTAGDFEGEANVAVVDRLYGPQPPDPGR